LIKEVEKKFQLKFNQKLRDLVFEKEVTISNVIDHIYKKTGIEKEKIIKKISMGNKLPGKKILIELCLFFDVSINYFLPPYSIFLREFRESYSLSISKLSKMIGISRQLLHQYENGEKLPSVKNFYIISKFYNKSIENIINYEIKQYKCSVCEEGK